MKSKLLAPFVIAAAALFSACSDSSSASTSSVFNLDGTAFATLPPTQSTTPVVSSTPGEGQVSATEQDYKILPEDTSRIKVAEMFGITVEALDQANVATPGYGAFYAGLMIKIPAGAKVPGAAATPTANTTLPTGDTVGSTGTTTTVASNSGGCTTGSYTILADDTTRTKVASKFDLTVDQLDAANANTSGYSAFYPTLKIIIPCP